MPAAPITSPRASASGLPCSSVAMPASMSARSRISAAALVRTAARVVGGRRAPDVEAAPRGLQRVVEVLRAGQRQFADRLAGRRIEHGLRVAAGSATPFTADVQPHFGKCLNGRHSKAPLPTRETPAGTSPHTPHLVGPATRF
ncbi:MAG: hypothetical protein QM703_28370 [Gemmatales bacterium]